MYYLAIMHSIADRQTDRWTNYSIMPVANPTTCSSMIG